MYTTKDNRYILFPSTGTQMNEERIHSPATSLSAEDSIHFESLLINCDFFNEISRFTNITEDEKKAKEFLKEYFGELALINSDTDLYKKRKAINIPLIKSIHVQLSQLLTPERI